jgi:hypothetical protein
MTTQFTSSYSDENYTSYFFTTDYTDESFDSAGYAEITICIAKTNSTDFICEYCSSKFNLAIPFYLDSSQTICLSHLPTLFLDQITLPL